MKTGPRRLPVPAQAARGRADPRWHAPPLFLGPRCDARQAL